MNVKCFKIQRRPAIWLLTLLVLLPIKSFPLGFRIPNQDAEATARGNAYVATADNPAALYYNPAGITQLEGIVAQYGLHIISVNSDFHSPNGNTKSKFEIQPVPQFYATMTPKESPFSFGLGIYAPFGLGVQWREDSPIRTLGLEGRLLYASVNPVIAWKVHPTLSLAAGPTINYSRVKVRQGIGFTPNDEFKFSGDGFDYGFTAGVLWQPHPQWSFGAKYSSETSINYHGYSIQLPYSGPHDGSSRLDFPQTAAAGISFRPNPQWNIEVDVDWTDWDRINTVMFKNTATGDIPLPLNWQSSFLYELGATRYFPNGYFASAGYFFSQNSTSQKNFTPLVPDTDLHVASLGFCYKGKHWRWAISGQIITGPARTVNGSTPSPFSGKSADGSYQWFNQAVNVSAGYHF